VFDGYTTATATRVDEGDFDPKDNRGIGS